MANDFYNSTGAPSQGAPGSSAAIRAQFAALAAAFDKMPGLAGNAGKFPLINSSSTGLTTSSLLNEVSGRLGIGTGAPGARLHLEGGDFWVRNGVIAITNISSGAVLGRISAFNTDLTTGGITLSAATASVFTEVVRVKPTGAFRFLGKGSAPAGAEAGDVYYDETVNKHFGYNGFIWNAFY